MVAMIEDTMIYYEKNLKGILTQYIRRKTIYKDNEETTWKVECD